MVFFELTLGMGAAVVLLTAVCEYIDSTFGMGYGTILTPVLLIIGFEPLQVVPALLLSQLLAGLFSGFMHHRLGNVDFAYHKRPFKVATRLAFYSVFGTVAAVFIAVNVPAGVLSLFIGLIVFFVGLTILLTENAEFGFSWKKIEILGITAAFNKALSGGGYGPVVVGGQLLSGVDGKKAVAITSLSEGLTCIAAFSLYVFLTGFNEFALLPYIMIGSLASVPFSAFTLKHMGVRHVKEFIGSLSMLLGALTVANVLV